MSADDRIERTDLMQIKDLITDTVLVRRFNQPTGLENDTSVNLVLSGFPVDASYQLNQESLGDAQWKGQEVRFDIAARIQPFNEIQIKLPPSTSSWSLSAWLEITPAMS